MQLIGACEALALLTEGDQQTRRQVGPGPGQCAEERIIRECRLKLGNLSIEAIERWERREAPLVVDQLAALFDQMDQGAHRSALWPQGRELVAMAHQQIQSQLSVGRIVGSSFAPLGLNAWR